MKDLIIIHDKLINYGGAEVVLASLVKYRQPKAIICACVSDRETWEKLYGVQILTPILTRFIKKPFAYKILYPYIISVCYLSRLAFTYDDAFYIVYSSSSGKYFRLPKYTNALLYVNYHAKGIRYAENYINNSRVPLVVHRAIQYLRSIFLHLEDKMVFKYNFIRAISIQALSSLPINIREIKSKNIGILHCPTSIMSASSIAPITSNVPYAHFYVVISRLTPEKNLKPLLDFLYDNSSINLIIIGDGPLFEAFVRQYPAKFLFTGFVDTSTKNNILSMSLGLIQPTPQEWSLVSIEANILGVPAIVAGSSAMEEINLMICGCTDIPNIIFTNFSELDSAFKKIPNSRSYISNNIERIRNIFSDELFHKNLSKIELLILNSNVAN